MEMVLLFALTALLLAGLGIYDTQLLEIRRPEI
jgi:hypothetical protein